MIPDPEEAGHECPDIYRPVIERLRVWLEEANLTAEKAESVSSKAEAIGLRNRIESAMRVLQICQDYRVHPGVRVHQIPDLIRPDHQPGIRVVDDNESDNPRFWRELMFENGPLTLHGGDLLISL